MPPMTTRVASKRPIRATRPGLSAKADSLPARRPGRYFAAGALASPALLIYNLLITLYLAYVGIAGELVGTLLWPAVALHAVLSAILVHARFFKPKS